MKRTVKRNANESLALGGSAQERDPETTPGSKPDKAVFSLSSLKITKPRTAADIRRAVAQGRVSELKSD